MKGTSLVFFRYNKEMNYEFDFGLVNWGATIRIL